MNEIKVRAGTPEDLDAMMALAMLAVDDNGLSAPNQIKILRDIWPALHLDHGIVGIIGNPIEAAILLRVDCLWYSDEPVLLERSIFVHPDFRSAKGGRARLLCDFAYDASVELGLPLVIGILSNERTAGKVRLYERRFGPPAGAYWIVGARTGTTHDNA